MNNSYWNWKLFVKLFVYYIIVFSLFVIMQVFNILFYIIFSTGFAILCTFINSTGVENYINDLYYSVNDMLYSSVKKQA